MKVVDDSYSLLSGAINRHYLADEASAIEQLLPLARSRPNIGAKIRTTATQLVDQLRIAHEQVGGLRAFLEHYDLSSDEGVVLMCLAEALLRIPDPLTRDAFIADKLKRANWQLHLGESGSLFVNASTWALMLSGRVLSHEDSSSGGFGNVLGKLLARLEEPVLRASLSMAMKIMAAEFVMGRTISEALSRAQSEPFSRYRFSYDMLGEAALTERDAETYLDAYLDAIAMIGRSVKRDENHAAQPGISVKLSALYPRFEPDQTVRAVAILSERVATLATAAGHAGVGLTLDAEETERQLMTLQVFARVYQAFEHNHNINLGLAVQAYQKRAMDVLRWLNGLSSGSERIISVRLVKGAYWDTEIKRAQEQGLTGYPVFTLKRNTDVSYLACARYLLAECPYIYSQFATHNAQTVSYIYHHGHDQMYEFQRLHGMGEELYESVIDPQGLDVPCRVYAPVGAHEDLLPYLVRRLLENGANTSFVNRLVRSDISSLRLAADPVVTVEQDAELRRNPNVPLPGDLYQPHRLNSRGINFADPGALAPLYDGLDKVRRRRWTAAPCVDGRVLDGRARSIINPADLRDVIGEVRDGDAAVALQAIESTAQAFKDWSQVPANVRAEMLARAADLFESNHAELIGLCVLEAGKRLRDASDEVREAVDFLRYYAAQCRALFGHEIMLPGPTGESNHLRWRGRGVFVCISPWNFPIAIFVGQIAAALAAGNTVVAKPAEQTSLVAWRVCELLYESGVPKSALAFLPGDGALLGEQLLSDSRIAGVAFTGSIATARAINRTLAARDGPLAALIAETGGVNTMFADSSALPEQVVRDAVMSAFNSAGQRCSALRILCVQEDIAERVLELLSGSLATWKLGDPALIDSDMGPVIDGEARQELETYIEQATKTFNLLFRGQLPADASRGYFVAPAIIEVNKLHDVRREVFGPVLHVLRFDAAVLPELLEELDCLGYGLTLGIQSRIEERAHKIRDRVRVGNIYVNRNMIGASVGVQPFGGSGLSGTGPKAGGPHYLQRFATEQTFSVNTAAIGGNAALLSADPLNNPDDGR